MNQCVKDYLYVQLLKFQLIQWNAAAEHAKYYAWLCLGREHQVFGGIIGKESELARSGCFPVRDII